MKLTDEKILEIWREAWCTPDEKSALEFAYAVIVASGAIEMRRVLSILVEEIYEAPSISSALLKQAESTLERFQ